MIQTAVIGAGFVGRVHMDAIRRLGNVELSAVVVSPRADVARVSRELHVPRVTRDPGEIFADPAIVAVHICTPNASHLPLAKAALESGKHVLCEKPLATSTAEAATMVDLARETGLRNCCCYNLRYYPMIQQARAMIQDGELGEILIVQGTYSQDWLLYDTDWNWRVDAAAGGPLRAMADIGSHWCDGVEHVTGLRITELCADLATFHPLRIPPKTSAESFAGKRLEPGDYEAVRIDTDDFGAVIFRMGQRARGCFTASQVSAGRKNSFRFEIFGTKAGLAWDGERPEELWIGRRNRPNEILLKDPSLLVPPARPYAGLPGGHAEGYADTFKQVFHRFYASIEDPSAKPEYPQFSDGLRQLNILDAVMTSHQQRAWVNVTGSSSERR